MSALVAEMEAKAPPLARIRGGSRRLAVFDLDDYRTLNPDLADFDLTEHYWDQGVWDRRQAITAEKRTAKLARAISLAPLEPLSAQAAERAYRAMARLSPTVHLPTTAAEREQRLARRIVEVLDSAGLACGIQHAAPDPDRSTPLVLGAATLFEGVARADVAERLVSAVVIATGFPSETGFAAELPYLLAAGGVAAVELETYALFTALPKPAVWCGPPAAHGEEAEASLHPLMAGLSRAVRSAPPNLPWAERPIDVLALEPSSPARLAAWSRMIDEMAGFNTVYHAPPDDVPMTTDLRRYLYARSKIVLHLHEGPPTTLGTSLAAEVADAGAVLMSEPTLPNRLLRPDVEYFESSARRMPALVDKLVNGSDGPGAAVAASLALDRAFKATFEPEAIALRLINLMLDAQEARP